MTEFDRTMYDMDQTVCFGDVAVKLLKPKTNAEQTACWLRKMAKVLENICAEHEAATEDTTVSLIGERQTNL